MSSWRRSFLATAGSLVLVVVMASIATAQVINPTDYKPTKNDGGWVYQAAELLALIAGLMAVVLVVKYMGRAPRFARNEEGLKVVRADRVRPGRDLPRRAVDVSQAASVVVSPPAMPSAAPVAPPVTAPPAPSTASAPEAPASAPAAPASASEAPAAAPEAAGSAQAPPAAAPAERPEVALDQEVFDKTLEELLAKGTDRRVAEGQARRAAMIAARRKAEGG